MLVLSDPDRFGISLDQLRQWILQAPGNRDGSTHRQIQIREFLAGDRRGAVHGGTRLADGDHADVGALHHRQQGLDKGLGFASSRPVADGNGLGFMLVDEPAQVNLRMLSLAGALAGVDRNGVKVFAGGVYGHAFAAGSQSGVDADHRFLSVWGSQQETAQVLCKDFHGGAIRFHFHLD